MDYELELNDLRQQMNSSIHGNLRVLDKDFYILLASIGGYLNTEYPTTYINTEGVEQEVDQASILMHYHDHTTTSICEGKAIYNTLDSYESIVDITNAKLDNLMTRYLLCEDTIVKEAIGISLRLAVLALNIFTYFSESDTSYKVDKLLRDILPMVDNLAVFDLNTLSMGISPPCEVTIN